MNEKYTCPCCGYLVFDEPVGSYEICPICFWQDDLVHLEDPEYVGGPNKNSLIISQKNFYEFGANDYKNINHVRAPVIEDLRDKKWYKLNKVSDIKFPKHIYYWDQYSPLISAERLHYRKRNE